MMLRDHNQFDQTYGDVLNCDTDTKRILVTRNMTTPLR